MHIHLFISCTLRSFYSNAWLQYALRVAAACTFHVSVKRTSNARTELFVSRLSQHTATSTYSPVLTVYSMLLLLLMQDDTIIIDERAREQRFEKYFITQVLLLTHITAAVSVCVRTAVCAFSEYVLVAVACCFSRHAQHLTHMCLMHMHGTIVCCGGFLPMHGKHHCCSRYVYACKH
jgi:hypothetical protein